ncbi:MAG: HAD-IA family hydrolase [Euryarchaeota archaeon]|nr:HAD-IA family hydrolase [Euryarchaeota archaeon]MBU4220735.1 HAD-IA family hydrolase [Euryarchaeota archaeon]MCG2735615.1 HAD-IA family hydrolase [Candidatus Methanoperedenaceae archaeon]
MKCLIFDLDQTLVDSQCIEHLRRLRQWAIVYQKIPTILAYEGIDEILSMTKDKGIKTSIVSSSPSSYAYRIVRHFGWEFDAMVCYHDTTSHKPHPAPFIEAAHRLMIAERDCWAVGDHPNDIIAAKSAGMYSVGALWGSLDQESLKREKPDILFDSVSSFCQALKDNF